MVDGVLTSLSSESGLANTSVVVHLVDALASVGARVALAVVDVDVAHLAGPARLADTSRRETNQLKIIIFVNILIY
jgi:hypothetical protein